jgi:hypothetical protein
MPDRDLQRFLVVSFRNDGRKADAPNLETPDRNRGLRSCDADDRCAIAIVSIESVISLLQ